MPNYNFTEAAESDVDGILDYTLQKWGVNQAEKYLDGLEQHARLLADTPKLAKSVGQFAMGLRAFPYQSHVIYFIEAKHGITIVRVLHESMSPSLHLE
jgi:toxin ParE1/3/4